MKIFAKGIGLVLLAVCAAGGAENAAKAKYQALVQRAQSGDRTVDLNELRAAAGEAGIESDVNARDQLMAAASKHDFKKMAETADAVLNSNYADLDGQFFAKIAAKELGQPEKAELHDWVEMGLLKSLRSTGDGQSPATAMKVISVDEEYFILHVMGQEVKRQALSECAGAQCDIMTTFDPESKQEHKWYFNIEIPMKHLADALGESDKPAPKVKK